MSDSPYSKYSRDDLILRDDLAIDRTRLANERTLLAYLRASVALLIAGASVIHFSQGGWFRAVGVACLPLGVLTGMVGIARSWKMSRSITALRQAGKRDEKVNGGG